jgi:leucyl aminopeptidase
VTIELLPASEVPADAVATVRGIDSDLTPLDGGVVDGEYLGRVGFAGKLGETTVLRGDGAPDQVLVGVGDGARQDIEMFRRVGAAIARVASAFGSVSLELGSFVHDGLAAGDIAAAIGEGAKLAAYRFDRFKSDPKPEPETRLAIVGSPIDEIAAGIGRAEAIAHAVCIARDLVNRPPGDLSPRAFATAAVELGASHGFDVTVLEEDEIVAEGLGGLLGVAAGSNEPPRFIRLRYVPEHGSDVAVALVGKGITFDSGGLSLKPAGSMTSMKTDMGGAAAVLGAFCAVRDLQVGVEVRGYLAMAENMPSGSATRPGDVLRIRNGKTIEVLNTDAEGRLVLADALAVASDEAPDAIVDLATLTGACVSALGNKIAGVLGNDDRLIAAVRDASRRAGEPLWPLPLPAGYHSHIDSEVADMKNTGVAGQAGALSAALLLQEFIGDVPWAHLDIAGPVRSEDDRGYHRKGATGFGVRTLLELLAVYAPFGGTVEGEAEGIGVLR